MNLEVATDAPESHGFGAGLSGDPVPMPRSHAHADLELNFVYTGSVRYFLSGRMIEVPERTFSVFWAGLPHQVLTTSPGTSFLWLHIPLDTALRWGLGTEFIQRLFGGSLMLDRGGLPWDAEQTRGWLRDMEGGNRERLGPAIELEVAARLRRLARSQSFAAQAPTTDDRGRQALASMASFLAAHYQDDIEIRDVAQAAQLKPNRAMMLFRKECGLSIGQYLTRLRLAHAQVRLLCTEKTVLNIALDSGFGSLARFYAAFQKECGLAPGEYRKRWAASA